MYKRFDKDRYHRRSIRLPNYDYSQEGAYFVTICAWNRECLFGDISNGEVSLNEYGQVVKEYFRNIADRYDEVYIDDFIVMPKWLH